MTISWELDGFVDEVQKPVYVYEADLPMMTDGESNLSSAYVRGDILLKKLRASRKDSS